MTSKLTIRRKFSHAVLVGKDIYCFPKSYPTILKINTETDELKTIEFNGNNKKHEFKNITVVNKDIFFIYKNTEKLLKLTTANDSIRVVSNQKFASITLAKGYIYCTPQHTRKNIIKLNTVDDSVKVLNVKGTNPNIRIQMAVELTVGDYIYHFLSKDFDEIIKIDTTDDSWEYMDEDSELANSLTSIDETNPIEELVSSDGYIYCIPKNGSKIAKISTEDYNFEVIRGVPDSDGKQPLVSRKNYSLILSSEQHTYLIPTNLELAIRINAKDNSWTNVTFEEIALNADMFDNLKVIDSCTWSAPTPPRKYIIAK